MMSGFDDLRYSNLERQRVWPGGENCDLLFRTVEVGGETGELMTKVETLLGVLIESHHLGGMAGEFMNKVKKLYRIKRGITGSKGLTEADLLQDITEELADIIISVDLIGMDLGIDLGQAVIDKFNKTSKKHGVPAYFVRAPQTTFDGEEDS